MSCDISLGRTLPCKDSVGGLKNVYFVNAGEITGYTMDLTNTDVIEAVLGSPSAYKYEIKDSSSFDQTIVSSREAGTTLFEQVLNISLIKQDVTTHKEIKLLAYGNPKVIVETNNGNFFLAGKEFGCEVTGGSIVSGTQLADMSGYTLTLTGREKAPANFLEATDEAGLTTAGFTVVAG